MTESQVQSSAVKLESEVDDILATLLSVLEGVSNTQNNFLQYWQDTYLDNLNTAFTTSYDQVKFAYDNIQGYLGGKISDIASHVNSWGETVNNQFLQTIESIGHGVSEVKAVVREQYNMISNRLTNTTKTIEDSVSKSLGEAHKKIVGSVNSIVSSINGTLEDFSNGLGFDFLNIWNQYQSLWIDAVKAIIEIPLKIQAILDIFEGLGEFDFSQVGSAVKKNIEDFQRGLGKEL